ncbi:hypothetical protein ASPZODRAFT_168937 [Penicilliopsis zonata CBS 506.65]|uniref:Uncharacterized protein n=1 Tax=Penicilliopsis zonata CBS 506.65 TaxID=1073090 RepID=A0A1L9SAJ9_9EURO|nr:hypothetical protein ASPZODRAFT_168937 [Penicilliopsis zonata CBS 506.65]OJJ44129.1 hypothetical protein ASPZODRAFT_168937 [Penicilliopsis zonata CBS 506.65]
MSFARPPRPLREWLHLAAALNPTPARSSRSFHSTASRLATTRRPPRSPAAQRAQSQAPREVISRQPTKGDSSSQRNNGNVRGRFSSRLDPSMIPVLRRHAMMSGLGSWSESRNKEFDSVACAILQAMETNPPTKESLFAITKDTDIFVSVGHVLGAHDPNISSWVFHAAAEAGVGFPACVLAARYLRTTQLPMRTSLINRIERLALEHNYAQAILVHAKVLGMRKQYAEAVALLEKVQAMTFPSSALPSPSYDMTMMGLIEPPWELYAQFKEKLGDQEAVQQTREMAAEQYGDPVSLRICAGTRLHQGNLDGYMDYMLKAASGGDREACYRLANFYYRIYRGEYPIPGQKDSVGQDDASLSSSSSSSSPRPSLLTRLRYLLGHLRPRQDYRLLAIDWHFQACRLGSTRSAVILALFLREDRQLIDSEKCLAVAENDQSLSSLMKKLRSSWYDLDVRLAIPEEFLWV